MEKFSAAKRATTPPLAWETSDRYVERCWRVIVAPEGRVAHCAVYVLSDASLQLRISFTNDEPVRVAAVPDIVSARSLAATWLTWARATGSLTGGPPQVRAIWARPFH